MGVLEGLGLRDASAYAAAARAAAAMEDDEASMVIFQSSLAIVDRARRSRTLAADEARALAASLVERRGASARGAARSSNGSRRRCCPRSSGRQAVTVRGMRSAWYSKPSLDASSRRRSSSAGKTRTTPRTSPRRNCGVSSGSGERQGEAPLDKALAAATGGDMRPLVSSLAALVYAAALGEADSRRGQRRPGVAAPPVSRHAPRRARRRARGDSRRKCSVRRAWHLAGSLLRLDVALAHLALRRLDPTEMPARVRLSTSDRRTLATSVALSIRSG